MKTIFTTAAVDARQRFEYWHDVACQKLIPHDATPAHRATFEASLQAGAIQDIGLFVIECTPMDMLIAPRHIGSASSEEVFFCRQLSGELRLEQSSRATQLRAGDFTVLDPQLAYSAQYVTRSQLLMLKLPRRAIESRVGSLRRLTGIAFTPDSAENILTSSYIEQLPRLVGNLGSQAEALIREQTLDLIALCLANSPDMKVALSSALSLISMRVRAVISTGLSDPSLNVRTVARRAGVSVRHANEVLAREGTSIARLILSSRLSRCRQALDDPRQRHRTVSEIAFSWGFCDLTHFGRRFRDTFGMPPREYRRKAFEDPQENGPVAPPP